MAELSTRLASHVDFREESGKEKLAFNFFVYKKGESRCRMMTETLQELFCIPSPVNLRESPSFLVTK